MHPCRPHHGIPMRTSPKGAQGRRSVRAQDGCRLCREIVRHCSGIGRRARVPRYPARFDLGQQPVGCGQRGRFPLGNRRGFRKRRDEGIGRRPPEAARGAQRVHRMGPSFHPRFSRQVHASGWPRSRGHYRTCHPPPAARQLCGRHECCQGDFELHGTHGGFVEYQKRCHSGLDPQVGATSRHSFEFRTRNPVRCSSKHQSHCPEATAHFGKRNQGVFLQVQRPYLREDGEARNHHQARLGKKHRSDPSRTQGILDGGRR
mmetsp:Transcript_27941/g.65700  ORF Transcript_27941/g.65700 Transcript_27941/m.65700 type:complete len:260 (+) Transcript_27941:594-1373(+)